ncbi:MAG TPA: prefoldin subunit beta [Candidatus Nanoarchaeia archaeon]|nr:prefoldin subunit beta [Candidatus Nanoarchaeia archaeon]
MKQDKIQELQILEQTINNLLLQKQAFQMEVSETQSALNEISNSSDEVFKIVGQLMIKTDKSRILEELSNKEKILEIRLSSIEKQEGSLTEKLEKLRDESIVSKSD